MKCTVVWTRDAENDLATIWLGADDRESIVSASLMIDAALKSDLLACGESRAGNQRIAFALPLGFEFEVLPDDRLVYVLAIWRIAK